MSFRLTTLRRFGFWVGPLLLLGSLLLGGLLLLATTVIPLFIFLLPAPAGGLLLGVVLIVTGTQPRWAKLLALSPVLGPLLLLLLLEIATLLPPPQNHLVFLLPVGFRGQVTLRQNKLNMEPSPQANGQLLLEIPRYGGRLGIREPLVATDLSRAAYYVVDASGERLYPLPQLEERTFTQDSRRGKPDEPTNSRQVGIFPTASPVQEAGSLGAYLRKLGNNPYNRVSRLTFIVACYDSLALQRQWFR